jgi:restriction system protein
MSRRKRSSPAEDLFELAARLPWWVCLILAVVSYVLLHPHAIADVAVTAAPDQLTTMVSGAVFKGLANVGQYALPIILTGAAVASFFGRRQREALARNVADNASGGALRKLGWQDFERLVGEAFRMRGYAVTETGGGGADGGIDLELRKGGEVFLVQCKQWRAYKVSVTVVRELYGVMAAHGAAGGFVVTSGVFTSDAKAFAKGRNIELIDGSALTGMIEGARSARPVGMPAAPVAASGASPACPKCGSAMVRRTARQGANAGAAFWGCSAFPKCRGVRAIE